MAQPVTRLGFLEYLQVFLILIILGSSAVEADGQFKVRETKDARLIYLGTRSDYLVPYVAQTFENALRFHERLFNYEPSERITVFMHDFGDYGNAGADALPSNHIMLSIAPNNFVYETVPSNERMNSTFNHELVHIVANDMAAPSDSFFRTLFMGKVSVDNQDPVTMLYSYLTAPRRYSPRWFHEGAAVFMETWMAGGLGRSLGNYDEMVFRTLYLENGRLYSAVGLESEGVNIDFQVGVNSYLYGTRFMSYLAVQYGADKIIDWVSRRKGSKGYFAAAFKAEFGKPLSVVWSEWLDFERDFQQANVEAIRKNPVTDYRDVSDRALGSVSRTFYDDDAKTMYMAVNYPATAPHIVAMNVENGSSRRLVDVKGAALYYVTSLAFDPKTKTLFYTTDNYGWRDLVSLNVNTGEKKLLIDNDRVGDLAFNQADSSLWGVRHLNGFSTIVRIPYPYDDWNHVHTWDYGTDTYDLDISKDGKYLTAALAEINGNQTLIRISTDTLLAGSDNYEPLFDFRNSNPGTFVFSDDGRYLYGSSYYSGVSNIFRYDLRDRRMQVLSNAETGFFRPLELPDDSLLVLRYSKSGFVPAKIKEQAVPHVGAIRFLGQEVVEKNPVVRDWVVSSPKLIQIDSLTTYAGDYHGFKNISVASAYPIIEGYDDYYAIGYRINFASPIGLHNLSVSGSYTPDTDLAGNQRFHGTGRYTYGNWAVMATYNAADFYDLFGPSKSSRKGYSLGFNYRKSLINDGPKRMGYSLSATGYGGLIELPQYQGITTQSKRSANVSAVFNFSNRKASIGAVDLEKGWAWQVIGSSNWVRDVVFPRVYTTFDVGTPALLPHSSFWVRTAAGVSFGARREPYANFYFGGFRNNWVDYRYEKRYRSYYALPGLPINVSANGTNFGRMMLEWNLPPLRFRGAGGTALYLQWARPALFAAGLITNMEDSIQRQEWASLGGQLDFRIIAFSYMPFTLSLGYGVAYRCTVIDQLDNPECMPGETEFMASFKIL